MEMLQNCAFLKKVQCQSYISVNNSHGKMLASKLSPRHATYAITMINETYDLAYYSFAKHVGSPNTKMLKICL